METEQDILNASEHLTLMALTKDLRSCSLAYLTLEFGWEFGWPGWGDGCGCGGGGIDCGVWACWTGDGDDIMVILFWLTWNVEKDKINNNKREHRQGTWLKGFTYGEKRILKPTRDESVSFLFSLIMTVPPVSPLRLSGQYFISTSL